MTSVATPSTTTNRWWALGALAVAMLTIGLDTTVLIVALPTLAVDLHADTSQLQWFSTAYTLVLAGALLPAGTLGDRIGRKRMLVVSMTLFGLASVACAYARTAGELIGARAVLGLAAAVMMPMSMAVLPVMFPDKRDQARALAVWVTSTAIGLPLGPIVGGWLLQHFWWGSVFLINVPLVCVGLLAIVALVPESRATDRLPFDLPGAVLSSLGLLALTYGFIAAGDGGWGDPTTLASLSAGIVALVAFVLRQRRTPYPLIDLALFRSREFTWGATLSTAVSFVMFGLFFSLPQLFQSVQGSDAFGTGLKLLPLIGGLVIGTRLGAALGVRLGAGAVIGLGFVVIGGSALFATFTTAATGYPVVACWLTAAGIGLGLVMPVAMAAAVGALSAERSGSGSALIQALRQAGGTIGVAVLGTVLASTYRAHLDTGPLPPALADRARDGVAAAAAIAQQSGTPALARVAGESFVAGMSAVLWVTVAVSAACAVAAAIALPLRPPPQDDDAGTGPGAGTAEDADGALHAPRTARTEGLPHGTAT
ncbi:MFS transporter [Rhodococcus spelaei]|uniref:MFS transporter n=1 Tax=Rhodococcus spelaei TaxID=2546320 RepID=A0A541B1T9_9NOCA|nr:MFS transporter [Rhodococcus spelaei]TQF66292.1 MFS transporter [Rhodococcus spelaei]